MTTSNNNEYEEKLERIINPQTLDDYSLSMTQEEFYRTKIGKQFIDAINEQKKQDEIFFEKCESIGNNVGSTLEKELFNVLYERKNDNT